MMSVNERFYLSRPPPWWVFGILCATVPLILVVTAPMAGQTIDWYATTPLVIVCLDLAVASTLAAMHRRRLTGSCFWDSRESAPADDGGPGG